MKSVLGKKKPETPSIYGKTANSSPTMVSGLRRLALILNMVGPIIHNKQQLLGESGSSEKLPETTLTTWLFDLEAATS